MFWVLRDTCCLPACWPFLRLLNRGRDEWLNLHLVTSESPRTMPSLARFIFFSPSIFIKHLLCASILPDAAHFLLTARWGDSNKSIRTAVGRRGSAAIGTTHPRRVGSSLPWRGAVRRLGAGGELSLIFSGTPLSFCSSSLRYFNV